MILVNKDQVYEMVSMAEAIDAMEWAFVQLSEGHAFVPQRITLNIPDKNANSIVMPAYALECPYYSVKIVSINYSNPHKGLPLIHATVQVFDASKGTHIATLDGNSITAIRTAAASGLATKYLAKKDAKVCAIFGTGVQAKSHMDAMLAVRDIKQFIIIGRSNESAQKFIQTYKDDYPLEIGNAESIREADIICTTTPSQHPLIDHGDVKKGCHLNVIGSHLPDHREVPTETIVESKVVVDSMDTCKNEAGELLIPILEGKWHFDQVYGELGELVSAKISGRDSNDEITLFKSVGVAIQDLAMAKKILEKL